MCLSPFFFLSPSPTFSPLSPPFPPLLSPSPFSPLLPLLLSPLLLLSFLIYLLSPPPPLSPLWAPRFHSAPCWDCWFATSAHAGEQWSLPFWTEPTQTERPNNSLLFISCLDQMFVSVVESRRMGGESWGRRKGREGAGQHTASTHYLTGLKSGGFHTHLDISPFFKRKYGTKPQNKFLLNYQARAESRLRLTISFLKFLFINTFVYEYMILGHTHTHATTCMWRLKES